MKHKYNDYYDIVDVLSKWFFFSETKDYVLWV